MLHIYFRDEDTFDKSKLIEDVEDAFNYIRLGEHPEENDIVKYIDQAEINDEVSIIDRFGYKLTKFNLSTGSKAALVVLNNPDKIVSLIECGINAVSAIITYCKNGSVVLTTDENAIMFKRKPVIDVEIDGFRFDNFGDLNEYIKSR